MPHMFPRAVLSWNKPVYSKQNPFIIIRFYSTFLEREDELCWFIWVTQLHVVHLPFIFLSEYSRILLEVLSSNLSYAKCKYKLLKANLKLFESTDENKTNLNE